MKHAHCQLDVSRITFDNIELRTKAVILEGILTAAVSLVGSTCAAISRKPPSPYRLNPCISTPMRPAGL